MKLTNELAKQLHNVYFGSNWTASSLKEHLTNLDWEIALKHVNGCNSILALTYHVHYFIRTVMPVLRGETLTGKDALSFDHPHISSQKEWDDFLSLIFKEVKVFIAQIEAVSEYQLSETFVDPKYGTYYSNIQGIIEHTHYHLGQIVVIKKIIENG